MAQRSINLDLVIKEQATNPEVVARMLGEIEALGEQDDWSPKLLYLVCLTIEELSLNALTHGRAQGMDRLEISIIPDAEVVMVKMSDNGVRFDPTKDAPIPDPDAPLENRPVGGLGIYMIREMVDDIQYMREEGRNHLSITIGRS